MTMVHRVEVIRLKSEHPIGVFCHLAKNLYNAANYNARRVFVRSGNRLLNSELRKLMRGTAEYRALPAQSAQGVLSRLDKNWKAFFHSVKQYNKNSDKFLGRPALPGYLKKDGEAVIPFTNQQCAIKGGVLKFPERINMEVKTGLGDITRLKEVRVVPIGYGYTVEIVYGKEVLDPKPKKNRIAAIDIGLANLVTMVDNTGGVPVIVKGGAVKAMNQFYNKKRAYYQSINSHQRVGNTERTKRLDVKRSFKLRDYFYKATRKIIDICVQRDIDTLVIGHNEGWKQGIALGRRTNQNFVQVPYGMLIQQLSYKAQEKGIEMMVPDEAHTSKCSFLDGEAVEHHDEYAGRRFSRGLFRSAQGRVINANVNGGYNILKKAVPNAFSNGIEGVRVHPVRLSI